jgi:hypothetical protein
MLISEDTGDPRIGTWCIYRRPVAHQARIFFKSILSSAYIITMISTPEDKGKGQEGTLNISVDRKPVNTARAAPAAFKSAPSTEPRLAEQVIDDNQDWELCKINGKEDVDGALHNLVEWASTLEPKHSLGHAKKLSDEFESPILNKTRS